MSAPHGAISYTFNGATFYRVVDDGWQPWFDRRIEFTRDLVLDSSRDYLDIGATAANDFTIQAVVYSRANQLALLAMIGTTDVLDNSLGYGDPATLISAKQIVSNVKNEYRIELTFALRVSL